MIRSGANAIRASHSLTVLLLVTRMNHSLWCERKDEDDIESLCIINIGYIYIVGFTLTVVNDFRRFVSQFSIQFS